MKEAIKKKEKTNSKGITLIALVITIIVLLILAGVTINLTLGENGIFRTAEMAGKNYTQAQEDELAGLAGFENTINNIIAGTGNSGGSGTDTPELPENALKRIAEPGDYVKYDTGIEGIGDNQDGILTFRVLYNDETNGLQIISDKNVENVTLGTEGDDLSAWQASMNDYNNAIATLNQKAERYATSSPYALDGRCVGSVPTVGTDGIFTAKNIEETGTYSIPDDWTLPSGWSSRDTGCQKDTDENYITDYNVMKTLENSGELSILTKDDSYWLASHSRTSDSSRCQFRICYINTSGIVDYGRLCYVLSTGGIKSDLNDSGLRPVILLKPGVEVASGDGSETSPFILEE